MNKKQLMIQRNDIARIFDHSTLKRNCLKFGRTQSKEHYQKQFELSWKAFKNGEDFATECVINTNIKSEQLRADFVNFDKGIVIEVAVSEKPESLKRKEVIWEKYGLEMIVDGM